MTPDRHAAVRRVLWAVLLANLAVIAAKVWIGLRSGSLAVLGDAAHSGYPVGGTAMNAGILDAEVRLLGNDALLEWTREGEGLAVNLPELPEAPAHALRISS